MFVIVTCKMFSKGFALCCLLAVFGGTFGADTCATYSGPQCSIYGQQVMINSRSCSRSCVNVWPLFQCMVICGQIRGPTRCEHHQKMVNTGCCGVKCIEILGEGDKCGARRNSMCDNMPCVDGICKKL